MKLRRKPLATRLEAGRSLRRKAKETVRRTPPSSDRIVLHRYETTSKRLQAITYKPYEDTIYFKPKANAAHVVGYVRCNLRNKEEINIDFLEVYEPFRKQGYGREIYDWIENYTKEMGVEKITVISLEEAVGFWKKMKLKRGLWSKPGYLSMFKAISNS